MTQSENESEAADLFRLSDIEVDEVSLVSRAANKRTFLIVKSAPDEAHGATMEEQLKAAMEAPAEGEEELLAKMGDCGEDVMMAMKSAARLMNAYKDQLPPEAMEALVALLAPPAAEEEKAADEEPAPEIPEAEAMAEEESPELAKALASMRKAAGDEKAALTKALEEQRGKQVELEKALKDERDLRLKKEAVEKAAREFPNLPATSEALGAVLKSLAEKAPEELASLEEVLKAANAAIANPGAFEAVGSRATEVVSSVREEIEKRAKDLVEKGVSKNLIAARARLYKDDKTLADREREESRG